MSCHLNNYNCGKQSIKTKNLGVLRGKKCCSVWEFESNTPDSLRARFPSTTVSDNFSLLCCQPEALHLALRPKRPRTAPGPLWPLPVWVGRALSRLSQQALQHTLYTYKFLCRFTGIATQTKSVSYDSFIWFKFWVFFLWDDLLFLYFIIFLIGY